MGVDIDTIDGVKEDRAMGLAGRGQGGDADSTRYNRQARHATRRRLSDT